ncbi:MAG: isochorismatase family protein [Burkholderiales bacterium]|nr:isochorismatase family protein [Burkholderiales bacterium]
MNYQINLDDVCEYNTHPSPLNLKKSALLIIEMQEVFRTDLGLISQKQIKNINNLINFANLHGIKIIYVRHNDSSEDSNHMIKWWRGDKIDIGSEGWQIIKEFDTEGYIIIDKSQYSAFFGTNLDEILKSHNITDLIISGVMTNCCCETAARDAFMRGYNVFFVNDATATINAELHLAAIKNLAFGFANVVNTNTLVELKT